MTNPHIAIVGDHNPEQPTHSALDEAASRLPRGITVEWVATDELADPSARLSGVDGIWVAPGSPYRSFEGALGAIRYAREMGLPLFGTWGGFQHVLVEYARNVAGIADAAHAEVDSSGVAVIVPLACSLVGEYRTVRTVAGTKARTICGGEPMLGYHVCGYGADQGLLPVLEAAGLVVSGYADDGTIEIVELPDHPFFLASLFQTQVGAENASADAPLHPLLIAFGDAVVVHQRPDESPSRV